MSVLALHHDDFDDTASATARQNGSCERGLIFSSKKYHVHVHIHSQGAKPIICECPHCSLGRKKEEKKERAVQCWAVTISLGCFGAFSARWEAGRLDWLASFSLVGSGK